MAETKRVSDQYIISAPTITIDGNLVVSGTSTTVSSTDSLIEDNIIVLNSGEDGAGITLGSSGIEIERGSEDNATLTFVEADTAFAVKVGGVLTNLKVANPVDDDDAVTKSYFDASVGVGSAPGNDTNVVFNDGGIYGANSEFAWDNGALLIGYTEIRSASILVNASNSDLQLAASGTGSLYLRSTVKLEDEVSDPSAVAGHNMVYSKTPGSGSTGLYYVNSEGSGEFVSNSKAIVYGIIF